jgi:pilus assembly protein CpaE
VRCASRVAGQLGRRYSRDKVGVVVSRFDKGSDIGIRDIEDVVQLPVRATFPSDYRHALQALNEGRPFVMSNGSPLASAVVAFTKQLTGEGLVQKASGAPLSALRARFAGLRWMTS